MLKIKRIQRQHLLREAQGYLELALLFDQQWPLDQCEIETLAHRSLECLDELEQRFGATAKLLYLKGQVYRLLEKFSQSIFYLRESSRIDPENIEVYLALGWSYKRIGRLDLAVAALESALDVDYSQGITHYNLACYWALAKQAQLAIKHLSIAIDIDPEFRGFVCGETDFDNVRENPAFQMLTATPV